MVDDGLNLVDRSGAGGVEAKDEGGPAEGVAAQAVGLLLADNEAEAEAFEEEGQLGGRALAEEAAVGGAGLGRNGASLGEGENHRAAGLEHRAELEGEFEEVGIGKMHDDREGQDGVEAVGQQRVAGGKRKGGLEEANV